MTRKRAKVLIAIGWVFSILLSLAHLPFPNREDPPKVGFKCERHEVPMTLVTLSGLCMMCSIIVVQVLNVLILRKRLRDVPGNPGRPAVVQPPVTTGRTRLYKRAITTSCMVAGVWIVGWAPLLVVHALNAWSLGDKETLDLIFPKFAIVAYNELFPCL